MRRTEQKRCRSEVAVAATVQCVVLHEVPVAATVQCAVLHAVPVAATVQCVNMR